MPSAIYLVLFCVLTYPLIASFSTEFFTNAGDGLQNVWNLWWVNHALTTLRTSPWFTTYLYYPSGVSLLGHTLNPFNGLVSVVLLRFSTLIQAHNAIVLFSFVMAGLGGFWLSHAFCEHYWASIIGGCVFTFSQYHFAHADGHLQLVSLEWIPVFALAWYTLVRKPSLWVALGSAFSLFLVLLCDFYYFAYCILYALIVAAHEGWLRKDLLFLLRFTSGRWPRAISRGSRPAPGRWSSARGTWSTRVRSAGCAAITTSAMSSCDPGVPPSTRSAPPACCWLTRPPELICSIWLRMAVAYRCSPAIRANASPA